MVELHYSAAGADEEEVGWPSEQNLASLAGSSPRAPAWLTMWSGRAVHGYETLVKLGGVVVHGAQEVLGLRAWDDAYEGLIALPGAERASPWVLFDLEKIVRMMLRQSGLALEILAGRDVGGVRDPEGRVPGRRIVEAAIHRGILNHYRDLADSVRWDEGGLESSVYRLQVVDAVRNALTGLALRRGRVDFWLPSLLERAPAEVGDAVHALLDHDNVATQAHDVLRDRLRGWQKTLAEADGGVLGEAPDDYEWLHQLVISERLKRLNA